MLNQMSLSSAGVLFMNAPVACPDGTSDLACRRASTRATAPARRRAGATAQAGFDATRVAEQVALATIQVGAGVVVVAGIASLFAPLAG